MDESIQVFNHFLLGKSELSEQEKQELKKIKNDTKLIHFMKNHEKNKSIQDKEIKRENSDQDIIRQKKKLIKEV